MAGVDLVRRARFGLERQARSRAQLVDAARALFAMRAVEERRAEYLQPGDRISARIFSAVGRVDLGEQATLATA